MLLWCINCPISLFWFYLVKNMSRWDACWVCQFCKVQYLIAEYFESGKQIKGHFWIFFRYFMKLGASFLDMFFNVFAHTSTKTSETFKLEISFPLAIAIFSITVCACLYRFLDKSHRGLSGRKLKNNLRRRFPSKHAISFSSHWKYNYNRFPIRFFKLIQSLKMDIAFGQSCCIRLLKSVAETVKLSTKATLTFMVFMNI